MKEFKKKCDLCKKRKQSRSYWRKLKVEFVHLCKDCWEKANSFLKK